MPADDPVSTLDRISLWMDAPERRLDFLISVKLKRPVSIEALREGAAHARRRFPRASRRAEGAFWVPAPDPELALVGPASHAQVVSACLHAPLDPTREPALRQSLLVDPASGTSEILTHSHHAAADLMSVLLFLGAQLTPDVEHEEPGLELRQHPAPVRKSRYAQAGPSTRLWSRRARPSGERRVSRFEVAAGPFRRALAARELGITYNDVLGSCALIMARRFQEQHGADTRHLSLWFPVSVRVDPFVGFGNGSSRIRVYERPLREHETWLERARVFRAQVSWSKEHGEWAVPPRHPLLALPALLQRPVLRAYFRRPWIDMGSLLFSHLERLPETLAQADVDTIEIVHNLDRRHPAGLAGVTVGDRTQLSLCWDPAQLDDEDGAQLVALYLEAAEQARVEIEACAG